MNAQEQTTELKLTKLDRLRALDERASGSRDGVARWLYRIAAAPLWAVSLCWMRPDLSDIFSMLFWAFIILVYVVVSLGLVLIMGFPCRLALRQALNNQRPLPLRAAIAVVLCALYATAWCVIAGTIRNPRSLDEYQTLFGTERESIVSVQNGPSGLWRQG